MDDDTFMQDDSLNESKQENNAPSNEDKINVNPENREVQVDKNEDYKDENIVSEQIENNVSQGKEEREKRALQDVKLDVRFEMNRIKTTLNELKNYEEGYVFNFNLDPDTIYLTVAGQTIGKGQLVEIGQQIGVRITEIYK